LQDAPPVAQLVDLQHRLQLHIPHPAHALDGVVEMLAGKIILMNIIINGNLMDIQIPIGKCFNYKKKSKFPCTTLILVLFSVFILKNLYKFSTTHLKNSRYSGRAMVFSHCCKVATPVCLFSCCVLSGTCGWNSAGGRLWTKRRSLAASRSGMCKRGISGSSKTLC